MRVIVETSEEESEHEIKQTATAIATEQLARAREFIEEVRCRVIQPTVSGDSTSTHCECKLVLTSGAHIVTSGVGENTQEAVNDAIKQNKNALNALLKRRYIRKLP
ncbi:hypothetical protein OE749_07545 [Aestuariibacter sp. AA17]|uniref:HPF/RaiA family ribosome-associated protein n=1 Tax=Fluctibacter corallii TaxID=2984329 RepID=A0ABT3A7J4_9ALTE|nr:hypothetical protein [Aestuariibacter sp. AA17]MCV2884544.1 hypothetical protein [Aestuariibacter sp. AA17]